MQGRKPLLDLNGTSEAYWTYSSRKKHGAICSLFDLLLLAQVVVGANGLFPFDHKPFRKYYINVCHLFNNCGILLVLHF